MTIGQKDKRYISKEKWTECGEWLDGEHERKMQRISIFQAWVISVTVKLPVETVITMENNFYKKDGEFFLKHSETLYI